MFVKTGLVRLFLYREEELLSQGGGEGGGWVLPYLALKGMCEQTPHVRAPRRVCSQIRFQFEKYPGVLLGILDGSVLPGSLNPDPICNFPLPFSDQCRPLKSIPVFTPGLQAEIMLPLQTKIFSNPFGILIFLFLSYSFGIKTINTFIHSCSSLENHTQFQTKMGKLNNCFQTKTVQKPYSMGRHIPMQLV